MSTGIESHGYQTGPTPNANLVCDPDLDKNCEAHNA